MNGQADQRVAHGTTDKARFLAVAIQQLENSGETRVVQ